MGFVTVGRRFADRKPLTVLHLTKAGREAWIAYVERIRALLFDGEEGNVGVVGRMVNRYLVTHLVRRADVEMKLADAKARFSEVVDRAEAGESIDILRRGKLVARVVPVEKPKVAVDVAKLKALTDSMPMAKTRSVDLIREMRDDARY